MYYRGVMKKVRDIPKNDQNQDKLRDDIEEQEAVVQFFTDKLNVIKAYN